MQCDICLQYTGCRRYGALVCAACAAFFRRCITHPKQLSCKHTNQCGIEQFRILKCQSCRLNRCLLIGMRTDRVKMASPRSSDEESEGPASVSVEAVVFAQVIENLVDVCKLDQQGTLNYLLTEDPEVLDVASVKFTQTYTPDNLKTRTKIWANMMYQANVRQEELPLLFQLTVIHFASVFYKFYEPSVRQRLSAVVSPAYRFHELENLCKSLISKL